MSKVLGPRQLRILRACASSEWFTAETHNDYVSALALHDRGLLLRDPRDRMRFRAAPAALAILREVA